jgi:hypothetical protein
LYSQSNPGQPLYSQSNPGQPLQGLDAGFISAPLQQGAQPMSLRPRWQAESQKDQNQ